MLNLGPLGPSLPFEKFLVVVVVVETNFSVQFNPKLNNKLDLLMYHPRHALETYYIIKKILISVT